MAEPSGFRKTGAGQQLGIIDPAEEEKRRQADAARQTGVGAGSAQVAGSPSPAPSETDGSVGQGGDR